MKKNPIALFTFAILFLIITGAITSCKKDNSTSSNNITDEETAEAVSDAVNSGGLTAQTETISATVTPSMATMSCGDSKDTTLIKTSSSNSTSYQYTLLLHRSLTCTNNIPSTLAAGFSGHNTYTTSKMSSDDSATGEVTVTQIQPSYSAYLINGTYERKGTQQSLVRLQRSLTTDITFNITNIAVSKSTGKILSGTASVQFTGTASGGASSSRGGTLTFNGNSQGTLVLDNGSSYTIVW